MSPGVAAQGWTDRNPVTLPANRSWELQAAAWPSHSQTHTEPLAQGLSSGCRSEAGSRCCRSATSKLNPAHSPRVRNFTSKPKRWPAFSFLMHLGTTTCITELGDPARARPAHTCQQSPLLSILYALLGKLAPTGTGFATDLDACPMFSPLRLPAEHPSLCCDQQSLLPSTAMNWAFQHFAVCGCRLGAAPQSHSRLIGVLPISNPKP
jgi:hypothetical protein